MFSFSKELEHIKLNILKETRKKRKATAPTVSKQVCTSFTSFINTF